MWSHNGCRDPRLFKQTLSSFFVVVGGTFFNNELLANVITRWIVQVLYYEDNQIRLREFCSSIQASIPYMPRHSQYLAYDESSKAELIQFLCCRGQNEFLDCVFISIWFDFCGKSANRFASFFLLCFSFFFVFQSNSLAIIKSENNFWFEPNWIIQISMTNQERQIEIGTLFSSRPQT